MLDEETAELWWASKVMLREKKLCDYVGRNEKTKIVAKLQKVSHMVGANPVDDSNSRNEWVSVSCRRVRELPLGNPSSPRKRRGR